MNARSENDKSSCERKTDDLIQPIASKGLIEQIEAFKAVCNCAQPVKLARDIDLIL